MEETNMNVLVIDSCPERRAIVAEAMCWLQDKYQLHSAASLREAREISATVDIALIIVGPDLPEDTLAAIVFLRGWLPNSRIITGTLMSHHTRDYPTRLMTCGADLVFDLRLSASRLALIMRPYLPGEMKAPQPDSTRHLTSERRRSLSQPI
jgi:DNA-binding NarL/FixJ family response regulator